MQLSGNGKVVAFATSAPQGIDADVEALPKSYSLQVGPLGSNAKTVVEGKDPGEIVDWLLTADGQSVVYIDQPILDDKEVGKPVLYRFEIASGVTKEIGEVNRPAYNIVSQMVEVEGKGEIRLYSNTQTGLVETIFDRKAEKIKEEAILSDDGCPACSTVSQPLSPDASKLLLDSHPDGQQPPTLKVLNLNTRQVTDLFEQEEQTAYSAQIDAWSPNSKVAVITPYTWKDTPADYEFKLLLIDSESGSVTKALSAVRQGADDEETHFNALGWSPDGKYIAYVGGDGLHFYDAVNRTDSESVISPDEVVDMSLGYGWVLR